MGKLTKKQKKELKRLKKMGVKTASPLKEKKRNHFTTSIVDILKENKLILLGLVLLAFIIYSNSLQNQLTLVDDLQAFKFDERIKNLPQSLRSLFVQNMFYAVSYHFFGYSPLPLRIASVVSHMSMTLLVFFISYILLGRKSAIITALIFAVHPVNTEAVTWISGTPYLQVGLFNLLTFLLYLQYKRRNQSKYIFIALFFYILMMIFLRSPWVLVLPIALMVFDQFFIEKKINFSSMWWLALFAVPISIYLFTVFSSAFQHRLETRSEGGSRVTMHAQALKPVIEGYPYTTFMMTKLYVFPKDLTVYYDGTPVTSLLYISMYFVFAVYVFFVFYFWKRNRLVTGILIMLPVLVAPVYSPLKVTWFISERYMYTGTMFFSMLIAIGVENFDSKFKVKYLSTAFVILLLIAFSVRTFIRNKDWYDTETLSLANMKTSPYSVRPYNDLGGHYYYKDDIEKAIEYYEQGLTVVPTSGTAINNLGFIFLEREPLVFWEDYYLESEYNEDLSKTYFDNAVRMRDSGSDPRTISFFLNKALAHNDQSVDLVIPTADFYYSLGLTENAIRLYEYGLSIDPQNEIILGRLEKATSQ
ncbi:hypothetical protein ACFL0C_01575 [Patescibacteria group bacterium]